MRFRFILTYQFIFFVLWRINVLLFNFTCNTMPGLIFLISQRVSLNLKTNYNSVRISGDGKHWWTARTTVFQRFSITFMLDEYVGHSIRNPPALQIAGGLRIEFPDYFIIWNYFGLSLYKLSYIFLKRKSVPATGTSMVEGC